MTAITVSQEKLDRVLADVETLIEDVSLLLDQDAIAKRRLDEIKANPSLARSEQELNAYLKKRGVEIE